MPDKKDEQRGETVPLGRRRGLDDPNPREEPAEFTNDLITNRFTPPPEPKQKK